jgi:hypothetical protein
MMQKTAWLRFAGFVHQPGMVSRDPAIHRDTEVQRRRLRYLHMVRVGGQTNWPDSDGQHVRDRVIVDLQGRIARLVHVFMLALGRGCGGKKKQGDA